jgi:hypothetical protein
MGGPPRRCPFHRDLQSELICLGRYSLLVIDEVGYIPFECEAATSPSICLIGYERASLSSPATSPSALAEPSGAGHDIRPGGEWCNPLGRSAKRGRCCRPPLLQRDLPRAETNLSRPLIVGSGLLKWSPKTIAAVGLQARAGRTRNFRRLLPRHPDQQRCGRSVPAQDLRDNQPRDPAPSRPPSPYSATLW